VAAFERHLNSRVSNRKLRLEVFCTATPEQADSLELLERLARDTQKPFLFDKSLRQGRPMEPSLVPQTTFLRPTPGIRATTHMLERYAISFPNVTS
jgi:hypothetical protein